MNGLRMASRSVGVGRPRAGARMLATGTVAWLALAATASVAQSPFEAPPVLRASQLASAETLQGPHHRVAEEVPTDGLLAQYTIQSDFGVMQVKGPGLLAVRVREVGALAELEKVTKGEVFANALAKAAQRTGQSIGTIVQNPVETVQGIPEGVGRFFERVGRSAKTGVQKAQENAQQRQGQDTGAGESATNAGAGAARAAGEVMGYYDARRRLAKTLGVDPYTTNPLLDKKLEEVAWAAFAGEFGVQGAVAAVPGLGMVTRASEWVWETSPGDLQVMIDKKLRALGVPQDGVDRFLRHRWYTHTMRAALIVGLDALPNVAGRADLIPWALTASSEEQARFVVGAVSVLARHHASVGPIASVRVAGTLIGKAQSGALVIPAPVDYVAWTERVATFARRSDLRAPTRGIWLAGQVSPRARQELTALGWRVQERFLPEAMAAGAP